MKNVKKILPMGIPVISSFPNYANPLSILQLNSSSRLWCLSNLTVLSCKKIKLSNNELELGLVLFTDTFMDLGCNLWEICPYLYVNQIEKDMIIEKGFVPSIIDFIDKDRYSYFYVNREKIEAYHSKIGSHDIFVYGYNLQEKTFYVSDFFYTKYESKAIPFEQLESGFVHSTQHPQAVLDQFITLTNHLPEYLKRRLNEYEKRIGLDNYRNIIIDRIIEYLGYHWNSNYMYKDSDIVYGIKVYDAFIEAFSINKTFNYNIVNALSALKDHKIVMFEISKSYNLSTCIIDMWSQIIVKIKKIIMKYIKYNFIEDEKKKREILANINTELKNTKEIDLQAMSLMLFQLQNYGKNSDNFLR